MAMDKEEEIDSTLKHHHIPEQNTIIVLHQQKLGSKLVSVGLQKRSVYFMRETLKFMNCHLFSRECYQDLLLLFH